MKKINTLAGPSLALWTAIVALPLASTAFGAFDSCPGTAASLNTINTENGGSGAGCEATNLLFNNYTVGGTAGTGGTLPTVSNLDMTGSTVGPPITVTYAPTATGGWTAPAGDTTYSSQFDGLVTIEGAGDFSSVSLDPGTLDLTGRSGTEASITVTENFCLGGTSTPASGGALTCSTPDSGSISIKYTATGTTGSTHSTAYTCTLGGVTVTAGCTGADPTLTLTGSFTTLTTQTIVAIDNTHTASTQGLASLIEDFGEVNGTPEPSTFVLLGSALVGFGFLRARRSKKA